jgi:hypothetical protein
MASAAYDAHLSRARLIIAALAALALTAVVIGVVALKRAEEASSSGSPSPRVALTADDQAAVAVARAAGDPRLRRLADRVARGEAGVLALADPQLLAHHRIDTSSPRPGALGELAAIRYHHR